MVSHDMQAANANVRSKQIRLSLGLLIPAERAAEAKRAAEKASEAAKQATRGKKYIPSHAENRRRFWRLFSAEGKTI